MRDVSLPGTTSKINDFTGAFHIFFGKRNNQQTKRAMPTPRAPPFRRLSRLAVDHDIDDVLDAKPVFALIALFTKNRQGATVARYWSVLEKHRCFLEEKNYTEGFSFWMDLNLCAKKGKKTSFFFMFKR
jgi:hypothetical protein